MTDFMISNHLPAANASAAPTETNQNSNRPQNNYDQNQEHPVPTYQGFRETNGIAAAENAHLTHGHSNVTIKCEPVVRPPDYNAADVYACRQLFYSRGQNKGETAQEWIKSLTSLQERCRFREDCCPRSADERLIDAIIAGMADVDAKTRLITTAQTAKLTLDAVMVEVMNSKPPEELFDEVDDDSRAWSGAGDEYLDEDDDREEGSENAFSNHVKANYSEDEDGDGSEERKVKKEFEDDYEEAIEMVDESIDDHAIHEEDEEDYVSDLQGEVNEEEVQRLIMKIEPTDFGSLKCNLCVETFHDEVGARRHLEKSHQVKAVLPGRRARAKCKICRKKLFSSQQVTAHKEAHKSVSSGNSKMKTGRPSRFSLERELKHYKVKAKVHGSKSKYYSESKQNIPRVNSSSSPNKPKPKPRQKRTKRNKAINHPPQIPTEDPLLCRYCGRTFGTKGSRVEHEYSIHLSEKGEFPCETCGKVLETKKKRYIHWRAVHAVRLPCEKCGKIFNQTAHLRRHLRMHEGVKDYDCTICGKDFLDLGNMREHVIKVHKIPKAECDTFIVRKTNQKPLQPPGAGGTNPSGNANAINSGQNNQEQPAAQAQTNSHQQQAVKDYQQQSNQQQQAAQAAQQAQAAAAVSQHLQQHQQAANQQQQNHQHSQLSQQQQQALAMAQQLQQHHQQHPLAHAHPLLQHPLHHLAQQHPYNLST